MFLQGRIPGTRNSVSHDGDATQSVSHHVIPGRMKMWSFLKSIQLMALSRPLVRRDTEQLGGLSSSQNALQASCLIGVSVLCERVRHSMLHPKERNENQCCPFFRRSDHINLAHYHHTYKYSKHPQTRNFLWSPHSFKAIPISFPISLFATVNEM